MADEKKDTLEERVTNLEHLLGVQLPLKKIPGLDHKTSLPPEATDEGRVAAAAAEDKTKAKANLAARLTT